MTWKILSLCLLPGFAFAQIAYDGFRPESGYSEKSAKGGSLSTQHLDGPLGWASTSWDVPGPKGSELFVFREDAALIFAAITYPGGGGVQMSPSDGLPRTRARNLASAIPFQGRTALYMSFLLRVEAPDCGGTVWAAFENAGGNNLGLGAGIHEGNLVLLSRTSRGERVLQAIGPAAPGTTYYFIIRLSDTDGTWKGADDLDVWVNPTDVSSEDRASATAEHHFQDTSSHNASSEFGLGRLMLLVENFASARIFFDEFALGESFSDVTGPKFVESK